MGLSLSLYLRTTVKEGDPSIATTLSISAAKIRKFKYRLLITPLSILLLPFQVREQHRRRCCQQFRVRSVAATMLLAAASQHRRMQRPHNRHTSPQLATAASAASLQCETQVPDATGRSGFVRPTPERPADD